MATGEGGLKKKGNRNDQIREERRKRKRVELETEYVYYSYEFYKNINHYFLQNILSNKVSEEVKGLEEL